MLELSQAAQSVLTRSHTRHLRVESWLGEQLLAEEVPVAAASEEVDRSLNVPERVTLTVPRLDRGMSWSPVAPDHPLGANGQRLRVQLGVGLAGGAVEWFTRGWFVVERSVADGDSVSVAAVGLLQLIHEARLVSPFQPSGTLVSTLRDLIEPALTVDVDSAVVDRSVPSAINMDEDRLGAVNEILDAWPAEAAVSEEGYLLVVEPPPTAASDPVLELTDGAGGTVIRATGSSTREGGFNCVVARGTASDGGQVQGVAFDTSGGPKRYDGPFNPLPVPYFFASPLLTTVAQAQAAARTVMARIQRQTSQSFSVVMVPHPGLQAGDVVTITTDDYDGLLCSVEGLSLPWTAGGGAQTLRLRSLV